MKTNLNLSCRFDYCAYNDEVCLVQNFKSGWTEPDPVAINAQCRVEIMLVALSLHRIDVHPKRFIHQLVTMPFGVMEHEFSYSELSGLYKAILGTLVTLEDDHAPLHASPTACAKCAAVLICPEIKRKVGPMTRMRKEPIDIDPKNLRRNLDEITMLRTYFDEFEDFCKRGLMNEEQRLEVDGWEMVPGAEKRDWKEGRLKEARIRLVNKTDRLAEVETELAKVKTQTVAAYQKIYASLYDKKPEDCREAFDKLMEGCIEVKQNKPSLKRVKPKTLMQELT